METDKPHDNPATNSALAVVENELKHINTHLSRLESKIDGFQSLQAEVIVVKKDVTEIQSWIKKTEEKNTWLARAIWVSLFGVVVSLIVGIVK